MARTVFVGGGNMAGAIVGGLVGAGREPASIVVVEPDDGRRGALSARFGVRVMASVDAAAAKPAAGGPLGVGIGGASVGGVFDADLVVWAVKPQVFEAAAAPLAARLGGALQLSVMAGIRSERIAEATGSQRVVRAMPNTPALVGRGIAGLYARPAVDAADREAVESVLAPTGSLVWLADEAQLDAVTALSGSGPAYVFRLVEAMLEAAGRMGLDAADARRLAVETVAGAAARAAASERPIEELRRGVTSPGGTTAAALEVLEARGFAPALVAAVLAAERRARELGG